MKYLVFNLKTNKVVFEGSEFECEEYMDKMEETGFEGYYVPSMKDLQVGESIEVEVSGTDLGYTTIQGIEYFVMGSEDLEEVPEETNTLDTYYVSKDMEQVYIVASESEFPQAIITRIK